MQPDISFFTAVQNAYGRTAGPAEDSAPPGGAAFLLKPCATFLRARPLSGGRNGLWKAVNAAVYDFTLLAKRYEEARGDQKAADKIKREWHNTELQQGGNFEKS